MWFPKKVYKIEQTKMRRASIRELLLKVIYTHGSIRGMDIARLIKVPFSVLEQDLIWLKQRQHCAIQGGAGIGGYEGMDFTLTHEGQQRAADTLSRKPYIGPAPVDLSEYTTSVEMQKLSRLTVDSAALKNRVLPRMVVSDSYMDRLGPAINSGGPIFLHGKPGNGKTMLAEQLAAFFRQGIFVPHAIEVDGQIIRLFDEKIHQPVDPADAVNYGPYEENYRQVDSRWVYVYRPFVVVGGELVLSMLDLVYQESIKVYEAPFQLKSNCGLLLIDDFGRQLIKPRQFLNRWIYPLEKQIDYLTLATGTKIQVPFCQFLIFSTNLDPTALADEAFWRRIKYKIKVPNPSTDEFEEIFRMQCHDQDLPFDQDAFDYLGQEHYIQAGRQPRGCHPRDLVGHMVDMIDYKNLDRCLSRELIDYACATCFVD